jgi:hypothetical protein
MLYMRYVNLKKGKAYSQRNPIFSSERMLHRGYEQKDSVEKEISGRESQGLGDKTK